MQLGKFPNLSNEQRLDFVSLPVGGKSNFDALADIRG